MSNSSQPRLKSPWQIGYPKKEAEVLGGRVAGGEVIEVEPQPASASQAQVSQSRGV